MSLTWPRELEGFTNLEGLQQSVTSMPCFTTTSRLLDGRALNDSSHVAEFFKHTVKAVYTYAVPVICVLGIIGDVTAFCIFVFSSFRYQPCSQYLSALTFVDTLFLISQLINSLMTFVPALATAPGYCSIMVYLSYVCSFLSAWFVVLMMLERYLVVCHPFRTTIFSHKKKGFVMIIFLVILSLCLYFHSFFSTIVAQGGQCSVDPKFYHFVIIFTYVDSFLTFIIPFIIIILFNLRIILAVSKFRRRHSLLNRSIYRSQHYNKILSLAQVRSTKMLVWVSSVFVILYLPSYAIRLYGMVLEEVQGAELDSGTQLRLFITQQLCQVLYYINFSVDFIVCFVSSSNFRRNVSRCVRGSDCCSC